MFPQGPSIILYGREEGSHYPFPTKEMEFIPSSPEFVTTSVPATDQYYFPKAEEQPLEVQPYITAPVLQQATPVVQTGMFPTDILGISTSYWGVAAGLLILFLLLRRGGD